MDFYDFSFPFTPFSIEKIYQTLETMFYQLLKQLECRQNHSAAVVLSIFFSVFGYPDETLSLVCDVIYQTRGKVFHRDIQTPRTELKIRRGAEYF